MLTTLVDFSGLDTAFPFVLAYPQSMLEDLLERRAIELGATVRRRFAVTGLTQDGGTVRVTADGPDGQEVFEAHYVAGCDGAGSTVRKAAGIGFPGTDASLYGYLGGVTLDDPPELGTVAVTGAGGTLMVAPLPGGRFRVVGFDPADQDPDVPLTEDRADHHVLRRRPGPAPRAGRATGGFRQLPVTDGTGQLGIADVADVCGALPGRPGA